MKKTCIYLFLTLFIAIACTNKKASVKIKQISVKAPFEMPAINTPDFSDCETFLITDFGAVQDNQDKTSKAIDKAIEKAHQSGCGIVVVPKGNWITGKLHFKSNVNLHLEKDAILNFSENPSDYLPAVSSTWEGVECYNYSPLIYAYQCENIAITGSGEVKANMKIWEQWFTRPPSHLNSVKKLYHMAYKGVPIEERQMANDTSRLRPQFIQFNRCENVLMDGITVTNSPFWVIHPFLSKNIIVRNVTVRAFGHNNDGIDPEMSQNMLVENCIFDQGDDAIAIKSGRNQDAWRLNTPTKNVVIKNCIVKNGHQLLAIGSELSGGIENIFMDSCEVTNDAKLNHLVYIKTNERRGGYVKNIYVNNIKAGKISKGILGIDTDVLYFWRDLVPTYEKRLTSIKDIYLENIVSSDVEFISNISGQPELPIENVFLKNIHADTIREAKFINKNVVNFNEIE